MTKNLLIKNCRLFNSLQNKKSVEILVKDGTITQIGKIKKNPACENILDAQDRVIAPGFIDVHIQGAGGASVLDGTIESLQTISQTCARFGTTSFLATTVFKPNMQNRWLEVAAEAVGSDLEGAHLLGVHLEGPFISLEKKGMILPNCICAPSLRIFNEIQSIAGTNLKMMTIAPEFNGSLDIIRKLVDSKIVASFGHSNASYNETLKGIDAGISHVTHLFNAMGSFHHRAPGPLLAIFETEKISVQIIPDGVHFHPGVLKYLFKIIGGDRCIAITDGMQSTGLPDGIYLYDGLKYESKNGTTRYHDGTLIGTSLGLSQLVLRLKGFTDTSLDVAIKTVTENPAKLLGIENRKGSIAVGKDADLVILDHDYSVWATVARGKIVFQKS